MKKFLIHLLDKFDFYVLDHSFPRLCYWIADSKWWGTEVCNCNYCKSARDSFED